MRKYVGSAECGKPRTTDKAELFLPNASVDPFQRYSRIAITMESSPVFRSENGQQAVGKSDIDAMTAINEATAHAKSDLQF
jgi:hypothetical protein